MCMKPAPAPHSVDKERFFRLSELWQPYAVAAQFPPLQSGSERVAGGARDHHRRGKVFRLAQATCEPHLHAMANQSQEQRTSMPFHGM